jgi:hypothetical protein
MRKSFLLFLISCSWVCVSAQVTDPGTMHNKVLSDLLKGKYVGSGNFSNYAKAISKNELGYEVNVDQDKIEPFRNNSVAGDVKTSVDNYRKAGLLTENLAGLLNIVIDHLQSMPDDELTPEEFNQKLDDFLKTLNVDKENEIAFATGISVLKKSYEFQYVQAFGDNPDVPQEKNRCKGFWKKLCVVAFDFVATVFWTHYLGPVAGAILGALGSAGASCCGICCPMTDFCVDSQLCCITFGKWCGK